MNKLGSPLARLEVYEKVIPCVLKLEIKKGRMGWSIPELSKTSKVPTSQIFYHIGKSKNEILAAAAYLVGDELFGLSEKRRELWSQQKIVDSVLQSRDELAKNPHLVNFYFNYRDDEGVVGDTIRELEKKHRDKIKSFAPKLPEEGIVALQSVFIGLVLAPVGFQESIERAWNQIQKLIEGV